MSGSYSVALPEVVEAMKLKVIHSSASFAQTKIHTSDVNRPALQMAGFYDYFNTKRLQLIGRVESTYLASLSPEKRYNALENFMRFKIVGLIVCHGVEMFPECVELAEKYDRNLFVTEEDTSAFMADLISYLRNALAPRITCHGVLVEVYGEGILITGDSGVGKSETALELIKRGHRLIADDAVEIRCVDRDTLVGTAPPMIRYYMELRGIGVIDARHIYGIGAVKPETNIDLEIHFELWDDQKAYDRLGLDTEYSSILDVKLPCVTIPVRPGRNLAVIVELAAMNNREKKMGFNAARTLADDHDRYIDSGISR